MISILPIISASFATALGTFIYIRFFFIKGRTNITRHIAFYVWLFVFILLILNWMFEQTSQNIHGVSARALEVIAWFTPSTIVEIVLWRYLKKRGMLPTRK